MSNIAILKSVDLFYRDCDLIFRDIVNTIGDVDILDDQHFLSYMKKMEGSENRSHRIFKKNNDDPRILFALMVIKMQDQPDNLCSSKVYQEICKKLNIDYDFPLLLITGFIGPNADNSNIKYIENNRRNTYHRLWMYYSLQVSHGEWGNTFGSPEFPPNGFNLEANDYDFNKVLTLNTVGSPNVITKHMVGASVTFKIRRVTDIKGHGDIEKIVEDLMNYFEPL